MNVLKRFFLDDRVILALVILNTASIFVGGYYDGALLFDALDSIFTLLFITEAVIKIREWSWERYWADGWNKLDFIVMLLALPSVLNLFIPGSIVTNVFLSLRVMKAFKSMRLFRFIPSMGSILKGIRMAIKASFVVAFGVMVLLLFLSMLSTSLFGSIVPEYFGTPGVALYSTFRLFTIEGWYEIPDAIAMSSSTGMACLARVYFSVVLFVGGILGMSLINSIFVDAAVSDNNDEVLMKLDRIEQELKELKRK